MSDEIEIVGYLRASPEGKPEWSEDCVCVDAVYPNYEGDESVSMPICRAADAKVVIDQLRVELAALKAGQGEAVEFCCEASFEAAKQEAWTARDLKLCTCDHHEYCGHCWPDDFKPGGKWHGGFLVKQQHQVASPPASADAVSVPGEFPAADDHEKAIGWEYSYEFISQVERLVASRTEFTTSMESVQETLKAACELRALLARQEVKS